MHKKAFEQFYNVRGYLNIIKTMYDNAIANIILNGKKTESMSYKFRSRPGCPLSPFLLNAVQ
jgi:hypothetical protein